MGKGKGKGKAVERKRLKAENAYRAKRPRTPEAACGVFLYGENSKRGVVCLNENYYYSLFIICLVNVCVFLLLLLQVV